MSEQQKWEVANARRRHGLDAAAGDNALFPSFARVTVPTTPARVGRLRRFLLDQLAAIGSTAAPEPAAVPETPAALPALHDLPVGSVCARCRGHCCRQGGDHAYLTPATLAGAARHTGTADGIVDRYLALVPRRSYAGSCIFHTPAGCALPRDLRSDTCNRYLCPALATLAATWVEAPARPYYAIFEKPRRGTRVYRVDTFALRRLRPSPPADGGA